MLKRFSRVCFTLCLATLLAPTFATTAVAHEQRAPQWCVSTPESCRQLTHGIVVCCKRLRSGKVQCCYYYPSGSVACTRPR